MGMSLDDFYLYLIKQASTFHSAYTAKAKEDPANYPLVLSNYAEWYEQLESWMYDQSEQS